MIGELDTDRGLQEAAICAILIAQRFIEMTADAGCQRVLVPQVLYGGMNNGRCRRKPGLFFYPCLSCWILGIHILNHLRHFTRRL